MAASKSASGGKAQLSLLAKHCQDKTAKVSSGDVKLLLQQTPDWKVQHGLLTRSFKFKDYHETIAFLNATAWISHQQNHHPDMEVGYNQLTMKYSTHSVGGLSENDFICAAHINQLLLR